MITIFPEVKTKMKKNLIKYQDKYRQWMKFTLLNIDYFRDLSVETYEELIFHLVTETYQANDEVLKQNNHYNKIFILVHGEVELYFGLRNKEIKIDTLDIRG